MSAAVAVAPLALAASLYRDAGGWKTAAAWAGGVFVVACLQAWTVAQDAVRFGRNLDPTGAVVLEGSSHLGLLILVPTIYWMLHRVPPLPPRPGLAWHLLATIPFSVVHVAIMVGLRYAAFALLDRPYNFGFSLETLLYEYRKDALTYGLLVFVALALRRAFGAGSRVSPPTAVLAPAPARPERIAVRKRDKEVLISVADIARIDAAGNYAVLHVDGETFEIRSSLTRLESDLDPARFVRVHKSHIVNVAHVREVEPWVNGDYRIRLEGGGEVNLSRRYRDRFERAVPVKR